MKKAVNSIMSSVNSVMSGEWRSSLPESIVPHPGLAGALLPRGAIIFRIARGHSASGSWTSQSTKGQRSFARGQGVITQGVIG